jgi:4-hydroxy-tetrahydrodipicolinate synthase
MQRKSDRFRGTGVAIVTPFSKSGSIDFSAYGRIIEYVIKGGVDYLVSLGTTGETPTLSMQEKKEIVEFSVKRIKGRIPLVVGIGGNNTSDVISSVKTIPLRGVDAILSVCPYYNKPQQEGIYRHFQEVAGVSPVPVILYTVPGRTGSNISAKTTLRLASECPNIIGIKEASGNLDQVFQVVKGRPAGFLVISGDDGLTLPLLSAGADGVISVVANAYPREFSSMVRFGLKGDFSGARKIHYLLIDFINALFADGSPSGVKTALNRKKLCKEYVRLPLVQVNRETKKRILLLMNQIEGKR